MAARCPELPPFFFPNASPGDTVTFSLAELGIFDTNDAQMFFSASSVERADDVNDTTFFPTSSISGGFRNAGSITQTNSVLSYTFDQTLEDGDCIMIQYTATNGLQQADSDCPSQTFTICNRAASDTNAALPCNGPDSLVAPTTGIVNASFLSGNQNGAVIDSLFITDSSGNAQNVGAIGNSVTAIDLSALDPDTYTLRYTIRIGEQTTEQCTLLYTVPGTTPPVVDPVVDPVVTPNPPSTGSADFTNNNLNCALTRWVNGTPQITCGGPPSDHVAELRNQDGSPFVFPPGVTSLDFITSQFPPGVDVRVVAVGLSGFTFRIDPSNAQCSGITNASIGV